MRYTQALASFATVALLALSMSVPAQQPSGLPDVVGIRPGMSAQEAYNILKARSNGAKVGVAQAMLTGISQPVAVIMSVQAMGTSPAEVITVWLTFPPEKQVVWGIRRTLNFEAGKEPTRAAIMDGLRQKYGPEIHGGIDYWDFDEQGGHPSVKDMTFNHCAGQMDLSQPQDPANPQPTTPLINAYLGPLNACSNIISVRTEISRASNGSNELAGGVTVMLEDTPIARRSRDAYQSLVNKAADAAHKQQIDNANQQKKPVF